MSNLYFPVGLYRRGEGGGEGGGGVAPHSPHVIHLFHAEQNIRSIRRCSSAALRLTQPPRSGSRKQASACLRVESAPGFARLRSAHTYRPKGGEPHGGKAARDCFWIPANRLPFSAICTCSQPASRHGSGARRDTERVLTSHASTDTRPSEGMPGLAEHPRKPTVAHHHPLGSKVRPACFALTRSRRPAPGNRQPPARSLRGLHSGAPPGFPSRSRCPRRARRLRG